ncbi:GNAT family N-acetyltransferase [Flavobacteriales bacterium 34_180_T64]|nr:GNAT family N-acetyltransferase [Flavobacteriales bacterium 34_180_T64]
MIKKLNHSNTDIAKSIRSVFQVSYAVEAKLLNATDFPPLKRPLEAYVNSETVFYGFFIEDELAAVVEINHESKATHIQSLVVDPKFFRLGIAAKLIEFVFKTYNSKVFTVETGLANAPACKLYKKLGFFEVKQYDTNHNIRKICFERIM